MIPSIPNSAPQAAPFPPLPDLSSQGAQPGPQGSGMADLVSGIAPVKAGVDQILQGVKAIVASGMVPGIEQEAGALVALVTSWLPRAVQQAMPPAGGGAMPAAGPGPVAPAPGGAPPMTGA